MKNYMISRSGIIRFFLLSFLLIYRSKRAYVLHCNTKEMRPMPKTETISVRVSEEDKKMIQHYSNVHGMTSSELLKQATIEKIEDDIDLELYRQSMKAFEKDKKTYTPDEVDRILGF